MGVHNIEKILKCGGIVGVSGSQYVHCIQCHAIVKYSLQGGVTAFLAVWKKLLLRTVMRTKIKEHNIHLLK